MRSPSSRIPDRDRILPASERRLSHSPGRLVHRLAASSRVALTEKIQATSKQEASHLNNELADVPVQVSRQCVAFLG